MLYQKCLNVTLSPALSESEGVAKGLGVVGFVRVMPGLTPIFFVAEFILSQANVLLRRFCLLLVVIAILTPLSPLLLSSSVIASVAKQSVHPELVEGSTSPLNPSPARDTQRPS